MSGSDILYFFIFTLHIFYLLNLKTVHFSGFSCYYYSIVQYIVSWTFPAISSIHSLSNFVNIIWTSLVLLFWKLVLLTEYILFWRRVTSAYFQNPSVGYWFLLSLFVLESDKSLTGAVIHNCMEMFPELNMARGIVFAVLLSP